MYTLFNDRLGSSKGSLVLPDYDYVRRGLVRDVDTVINYYRTNSTSIRSDHLLVQILTNLNVSLSEDVKIYRDRADALGEDISMAMGLTTPWFRGRGVQPTSWFYGTGSKEIVLTYVSDYPTEQAVQRWEDLEPVKFLSHPKTDLGLDVPRGEQNSHETGFSVILVDIGLLAIQYRQWRLREIQLNFDAQRTKSQFVSTYPLPNMLRSQVDLAVFNRMSHTLQGKAVSASKLGVSFYLQDWSNRMDQNLREVCNLMTRRPMGFDHTLAHIPMVSSPTLRDVVKIPKMALTRQVTWALTVARLPVIRFLVELAERTGYKGNGTQRNEILTTLKQQEGDGALRDSMDPLSHREIKAVIKDLKLDVIKKL